MTGASPTSWSWLHNIAVPALVAVVEATWISAWLVVVRLGPHRPAHVAFLAVAAPAVTAVTVAGLACRFHRRRRPRRSRWIAAALTVVSVAVGVVVVVGGMACSAGAIAQVVGHAGWAAAGFHPWNLHQPVTVATARLAWLIAITTWLGGLWLGYAELAKREVMPAVALAAVALTVFFVAAAAAHSSTLHREAGTAALLLLIAFPGGSAALAFVHERDLERRALRRPNALPSGAWLAALMLPMAVVALAAIAAVLVAVVIGPLAALVGRALLRAAVWIGSVIAAALRWLGHLVHLGHTHTRHPPMTGHAPIALVVIVLVVGLLSGIRALMWWYRHRSRRVRSRRARSPRVRRPGRKRTARRPVTAATAEQVDFVFSWAHLLDQLLALLRGPLRWLTSRAGAIKPPSSARRASAPQPDSVRAQYRRLLATALAAGHGRHLSETPLELERRLAALDPDRPDDHLDALTLLYNGIRYGDTPDRAEHTDAAARHVTAITSWLHPNDHATAPRQATPPDSDTQRS